MYTLINHVYQCSYKKVLLINSPPSDCPREAAPTRVVLSHPRAPLQLAGVVWGVARCHSVGEGGEAGEPVLADLHNTVTL